MTLTRAELAYLTAALGMSASCNVNRTLVARGEPEQNAHADMPLYQPMVKALGWPY